MSKTLTAQANASRQRRDARLRYLLEFTLYRDRFKSGGPSGSLVVRASDLSRYLLGEAWLPLVAEFGTIADALALTSPAGAVGIFDPVLSNLIPVADKARFSDLLRHGANDNGAYDLTYSEALLLLVLDDGQAGDEIPLFRLWIEEPRAMGAERLQLRMSGIEGMLEDRHDLLTISTTTFPSADPDVIGQNIPIPIGRLVNMPGYPIVAGIMERLRVDITATSPANGGDLLLSDPDLVGLLATVGLRRLQVNDEQIDYTAIVADTSNPRVTGITRGAGGTVAQPHSGGTSVFQVLTEYVYGFGQNRGAHKATAIPAVRSGGQLLSPSSYTVELSNTTLFPGEDLILVRFPVLPKIEKQVSLEVIDLIAVADGIGVQDQIAVNDGMLVGDNISASTPSSEQLGQAPSLSLPYTLNDQAGGQDRVASVTIPWPSLPAGGVVLETVYNISLVWQSGLIFATGSFVYTVTFAGSTWYVYGNQGVYDGVNPWRDSGSLNLQVRLVGGGAYGSQTITWRMTGYTGDCTVQVTAAMASVRRTIPINKAGAASRSGAVTKSGSATKTGTAAKVGTVTLGGNSSADSVLGFITADVQGLQDDASGTISGTPYLLLENPADIVKLLLREYYGESDLSHYDLARWAATRAQLEQLPYRWATAFAGLPFSQFRREVGLQSRCELFQESAQWVLGYRGPRIPVMTLDDTLLERKGSPLIGLTAATELATRVHARYDFRSWTRLDAGRYRGPKEFAQWRKARDSISAQAVLDRVGNRVGRDDQDFRKQLDLTFVRDDATAAAVSDYWRSQWEKQWLTASVRLPWAAAILDKQDTVIVRSAVLSPYAGAGNDVVFAVRRKGYATADAAIELDLVEVGLLTEILGIIVATAAVLQIRAGAARLMPGAVTIAVSTVAITVMAPTAALITGAVTIVAAAAVIAVTAPPVNAIYYDAGATYDSGGAYDAGNP